MSDPDRERDSIFDILIVDDTIENIRFLSDFLTEQNYQVRKAINGKTALKTIAVSPPDLILLDVRMPDMNGYEVCQQLKSDPQTRGIPIIFLSAADEQEDKKMGFRVGGVDYITKPFQLEEVFIRVQLQLTIKTLQNRLDYCHQQLQATTQALKVAQQQLKVCQREDFLPQYNQED
ncbi:MAG: response regulator [Jaaginema sp. PMC 1079.18]|nr:response regulator [Jaaginema sp. PMC 1080.18]MEC4850705.1 response regulator [Jaaginema sp. PMC 1079.18]MEC4864710.1 response regulator [Jaaginema sp. PMC 1078.18]